MKIATRVENQGPAAVEAQLWTEIIGPDGKVLRAAAEPPKRVIAGRRRNDLRANGLRGPARNSGRPTRRSCTSPRRTVIVGGETADFVTTNFGIRTVEFTKDRGMLINGRHVPVNGVCNHHDLGCLGSAVHARGIQRQLEILKGMGCNAIRTSHNPPDPALLDLCDAMGFVVMDEAFDEWKAGKTPHGYGRFFDEWSERDLVSMLDRDRNHPCVVLWSIGNEIPEQGAKNGYEMSKRLVDICHREDPTRPTTSACNDPGAADRTGYAKPLDVFGINYNIDAYRQFKDKYNLIASETASALSTRDEYGLKVGKDGKVQIQRQFDHQVTSYDLVRPQLGLHRRDRSLGLAARRRGWRASSSGPASTTSASRRPIAGRREVPTSASSIWPASPRTATTSIAAVWRPEPLVHLLAPLELGGTGRQGDPRLGRHELRQRRTVPQRQVAGRKEARPRQVVARRVVRALRGGNPAGRGQEGRQGSGQRRGPHGGQAEAARAAARPREIRLPTARTFRSSRSALSMTRASFARPRAISCVSIFPVRRRSPGWTTATRSTMNSFKADKHTVFHGLGLAVVKRGPQSRQDYAAGRGRWAGSRPKPALETTAHPYGSLPRPWSRSGSR